MAGFRNTPLAVWGLFWAHIRQLENQSTGDGRAPFRKVAEGEITLDAYPVPFLSVRFNELEPTDRTDGDKKKVGTIKIKIMTAIPAQNDATNEILSKIAMVDNKIESFLKPDGVNGFENSKWGTTYMHTAEHGNLISAECELTFAVVVARGNN